MAQPTLINFHPNEYGQSLRFFPFAVNLYSCMVSCNTLNDLFDILAKEKLYGETKAIKIQDVAIGNMINSKLVETKKGL